MGESIVLPQHDFESNYGYAITDTAHEFYDAEDVADWQRYIALVLFLFYRCDGKVTFRRTFTLHVETLTKSVLETSHRLNARTRTERTANTLSHALACHVVRLPPAGDTPLAFHTDAVHGGQLAFVGFTGSFICDEKLGQLVERVIRSPYGRSGHN